MKESSIKIGSLERRCPRLGGDIQFSYCRSCGDAGSVCFKIMDCWWERFDVTSYLQNSLSKEDFEALKTANPPPKITNLIDLIQAAQHNTGGSK